jgi:serine protease Do
LKSLLCLLVALSTALASGQGTQISPEEIRSLELSPAVVFISVQYKLAAAIPVPGREKYAIIKRTPMSTGSGFLYRPDGYLITNAHVVSDANTKDPQAQQARLQYIQQSLIKMAEDANRRPMTDEEKDFIRRNIHAGNAVITVTLNNKVSKLGEIKAYSDPTGVNVGKDIAIVKIDANNLPTVPLGNSDNVHVEEPVTVIGYPGAASAQGATLGDEISEESMTVPTVTNGHISAVKMDYKGSPVLQSDAAITHGNSGGPAFDPDGKAIGIATFGAQEASGFNFFVPINTAMEFVRQAGAAPETGSFDTTWHGALDAMSDHNWSKAHTLIGDALEIMPGEPDAERLQVIAAQEEQKDVPMGPWIAAGAAALILILALVGWRVSAVRARAAKAPAQPPAPVAVRSEAVKISHPEQAATVLSSSGSGALGATVLQGGTTAEIYGTLHVTSGPLNGNRFPITKEGVTIGRDSTKCTIVLPDESVSKEHAWIVPVDNEVVVIDRNSTNGTYVNSTELPRVNKTALRSGDRVFIGRKGVITLTYFSS